MTESESVESKYKALVEAAIFASAEPVNAQTLEPLLVDSGLEVQVVIDALQIDYQNRGVALTKVASGYRFQVREAYAQAVTTLYERNPPRYTRALLETLAFIAYKQPVTRGDIEQVRGVAVSTGIMKTLQDRGWIKISGYRDGPGKAALFATTPLFLDYFGLNNISDLPPLITVTDALPAAETVEMVEMVEIVEIPESSESLQG